MLLIQLTNSCSIKLHDYMLPKSELFIPRNKTSEPAKSSHSTIQPPSVNSYSPGNSTTPIPELSLPSSPAWDPSSRTPQLDSDNAESLPSPHPPPNPFDISSVYSHSPDNATPIPESSLPSSPALDPSSRTPQPDFDNAESLASPSSPLDAFDQEHTLLDSRLREIPLKVSVTGGKFNKKELTASVRFIEGRLSIQHHFYKSWDTLLPKWVTPKYPNPTRDNGLLVIIKGDHCGKYVRRIHHRYEAGEAIVILAVVNRVDGYMDNLSGEQLELDVSHLCVCQESKEDKGLNRSLMDALREEARKTRAK